MTSTAQLEEFGIQVVDEDSERTPTLSILVASSGRETLPRALASVTAQMLPGDELIVDVNDDAPYGHLARNRMMPRAHGDALLFLDDDDEYADGALAAVRAGYQQDPLRLHVFRMRYPDGSVIWRDGDDRLYCGNVSTQTVCVPRYVAVRHEWGHPHYAGDWEFINDVATDLLSDLRPPVFHDDVITLVRPC